MTVFWTTYCGLQGTRYDCWTQKINKIINKHPGPTAADDHTHTNQWNHVLRTCSLELWLMITLIAFPPAPPSSNSGDKDISGSSRRQASERQARPTAPRVWSHVRWWLGATASTRLHHHRHKWRWRDHVVVGPCLEMRRHVEDIWIPNGVGGTRRRHPILA